MICEIKQRISLIRKATKNYSIIFTALINASISYIELNPRFNFRDIGKTHKSGKKLRPSRQFDSVGNI